MSIRQVWNYWGYTSKAEMMGSVVKDSFLHPEDYEKLVEKVKQEGFVKDFEVKPKIKNGTLIDVWITNNAGLNRNGFLPDSINALIDHLK